MVAGGGPTGMMLAAELVLGGADVVVVEQRESPELESARSGGVQSRTLELLDQRGIGERFVSQGTAVQTVHFPAPVDISDFPTKRPYGLGLFQNKFEAILREWADELGVRVQRGAGVTALAQDDDGVDVTLSDGRTLRAGYLVGCDGGRSTVRKLAGIEFPGWDASMSSLLAEARITDESEVGKVQRDEKGVYAIGKLDDGFARLVVREDELGRTADPTLDELREAMVRVWGSDFGVHEPRWISRFTDTSRQAATYRSGRVLLAGDAAHIHSPVGGQGMGTGLQDAVNLGWKLALVANGVAPDRLLDSYHDERHPVGARVLQHTMALSSLNLGDPRSLALRDQIAAIMALDEPRRMIGGALSGLDIHYDLGEGHPLLGRRMPDLELESGSVFSHLHQAQPVLLCFGAPIETDRVPVVNAEYEGPWELPVLGAVDAPSAVLVRPDGYVAWAGDGPLDAALERWFGPA